MENPTLYKLKPFSGKIFSEINTLVQKFDPYLVIKYASSTFYTSISKNTGKFPYWNDSFSIRKFGDEKIMIECWDYNVDFDVEKEAFIGKGLIDQSKCLPDKKTLLWVTMERPSLTQKEELEKTCELLIEIEVCSVKKEENEGFIENQGMILEEINTNIPLTNEKVIINEIFNENEANLMRNIEKKPFNSSTNNGLIKIQQHQQPVHTSQRSFSNGLMQPNKVIPTKVFQQQSYGGMMNIRRQNPNPNMMVYHQHQHQPQIQYSL